MKPLPRHIMPKYWISQIYKNNRNITLFTYVSTIQRINFWCYHYKIFFTTKKVKRLSLQLKIYFQIANNLFGSSCFVLDIIIAVINKVYFVDLKIKRWSFQRQQWQTWFWPFSRAHTLLKLAANYWATRVVSDIIIYIFLCSIVLRVSIIVALLARISLKKPIALQ